MQKTAWAITSGDWALATEAQGGRQMDFRLLMTLQVVLSIYGRFA